MTDLINTFSWSYSAANDFETCPRKRYWSKYAAWKGWERDAAPQCRAAYRFNKMESRYTLMGRATEEAVRWLLRAAHAGDHPSAEQAYDAACRPLLNRAWKQSKSGAWRDDPKRVCCFHEHYYPQLHPHLPADWPERLKKHILQCLHNFIEKALPRFREITPDQEVTIPSLESFELDGIRVYAVPDYVHRSADGWHLHDWKAGKPRASHHLQMAVYALWAHTRHQVAPADIQVYIEYLCEGQVAAEQASEELLEQARHAIRLSAADMAEYVKDGDVTRNVALPREEWDMTPERSVCERCNFYELCAPEF